MSISDQQIGSGFIDSHCHLDHLVNTSENVTTAFNAGIERFVVPSTSVESWQDTLSLQADNIAIALGTHPWYVKNANQEEADLKREVSKKISAVGEIGLDFYPSEKKPRPNRELQIDSFSRQLAIAADYDLPVIIHSVKSHADVLSLLKRYSISSGVIHAFTGSAEQAWEFVKQGMSLGVGPAILRSNKTQAAFKTVTLEHLVLETDAPYMNAVLAKENPLLALLTVAEKLAELKGLSIDSIRQQTAQNALTLFFNN